MGAALAIELVREFAFKSITNNIMPFISFQINLYFLHELTEELVRIALHHRIYRKSLISDK
jgi:hypothetical protein